MSYYDELEAEREFSNSLLRELKRRPPVAHILKLEDGRVVKVAEFVEVVITDEVNRLEKELEALKQHLPKIVDDSAPEAPAEAPVAEPAPEAPQPEPTPEVASEPVVSEPQPVEPTPESQPVVEQTAPQVNDVTPPVQLG